MVGTIFDNGPEHVLCFAPTRSGKGVGLVAPSLLTWPGSAIVHDIKGENWQLTAGWRARFGRVLLFDPTNPVSAAYNPLLEVRRGDTEVRDVQNVADENQGRDFTCIAESVNAVEAWLGSLPGHVCANIRRRRSRRSISRT